MQKVFILITFSSDEDHEPNDNEDDGDGDDSDDDDYMVIDPKNVRLMSDNFSEDTENEPTPTGVTRSFSN